MKALITGGSGFIGAHLCASLLRDGYEVVCLDNFCTSDREAIAENLSNPAFDIVRHDVCEPFHVQADEIYHLACPASPVHYQRNPVRTIKTAVMGTLNALECARDTDARLLITSTSEVYGDPTVHPQPETYWGHVNPVGPRACYDEGKRCGEALAASWARQYGTDIRIARLFNCYGPGMAAGDGRLLPNLINQALSGDVMTVYGDGSQTRSFCYVDDVVRGLRLLMRSDVTSPVNIGNPDERTILSVAEAVRERVGSKSEIVMRPLPEDDPRQRRPDISKAIELLGWMPSTPFGNGLAQTVAWFR